MSDEASISAGLDAFARHSQDVDFFRALAAIAELGATQELAVDELMQRFGSHRKCMVHLYVLQLHATKTMQDWMATLCVDASQKGISLYDVSEADASAARRALQAPVNHRTPNAPQ